MKKVYYLSTCDTCKRIMKEVGVDDFEKQDIKTEKITEEQVDQMKELAGNYEALFNRRSRKFKEFDLSNTILLEPDYKLLILQEYTFLKRPVFIVGNHIFIGNSKKTVEALKKYLHR